jgi:hypothetical protein
MEASQGQFEGASQDGLGRLKVSETTRVLLKVS